MKNLPWSVTLFAVILVGSLVAMSASRSKTARADAPTTHDQPQPVEKDMHEFMEYVFQPTYKRLKLSIASEPTDKGAWKGIKADALILTEGGNLLLLRKPKENVAIWDELSAAVRESGGDLYLSAKKKDYPSARQHYESMLTKCNACHDKFADGKHQLSPQNDLR
jgi:cytochrome c553